MSIRISSEQASGTGEYTMPDIGTYEFRIVNVREPQTRQSYRWNPPAGHDPEKPYRTTNPDGTPGPMKFPYSTSVIVEFQIIGDRDGLYADPGEVVFYFVDLYPNSDGSYRLSKKGWEILKAIDSPDIENLEDLTGATVWGDLTHKRKENGEYKADLVNWRSTPPTPQVRQRARIARQEPPQAAPDPVPDDEAYAAQGEDITTDALPGLTQLEQSLLAEVQKAPDQEYLSYLEGRYRRTGTLTEAVQHAIDRKAYAMSLTD